MTSRTRRSQAASSPRYLSLIATASRSAVPPIESTRAMRAASVAGSRVNGTSMRALSAKLTTNTSSSGFEARTNDRAATSTRSRRRRMLPLLSMSSPSDTGMSSRRNNVIGCCLPFSYTVNARWSRSTTSAPRSVFTVAWSTTRRVSVRNVGVDWPAATCGTAPRTAAIPTAHHILTDPHGFGDRPGASCTWIGVAA